MSGTIEANTPWTGVQMNAGVCNSSEWLVTSPAQARMAFGTIALDGSNPTPITTGLNSVSAFVATLQGSAAPGDSTFCLTYTASGGTVSVYAWKTDGSDPTLIASTGTETISWVAFGAA